MGDTFADWLQAGGLILGVDGLREDTARYVVELLDVCIAIPCSESPLLKTLNDQVWRPASSLCLAPGCAWTCPSLPPKDRHPNIPSSGSRWDVTFPFCPACPLHKASSSPPGPFASQFHYHTAYGANKPRWWKISPGHGGRDDEDDFDNVDEDHQDTEAESCLERAHERRDDDLYIMTLRSVFVCISVRFLLSSLLKICLSVTKMSTT